MGGVLLYTRVDVDALLVAVTSFFFNDTATTEIYTLSLHDALPISEDATSGAAGASWPRATPGSRGSRPSQAVQEVAEVTVIDRKSTRLNSSHANISYAVFCLKK